MLKVQDIMITDVHTADPHDPIAVAAQRMSDDNTDCLVIMNSAGVIGVITDRDLALGCLIDGHDSWECHIFRHMAIQPDTVDPDANVSDVAILMMDRNLSVLTVVSGQRLVGLLYSTDVTKAIDHEMTQSSLMGAA